MTLRYPAYKDSGVEWLGQVPEGWTVVRTRFVAAFSSGGTPSRENLDFWGGDIPWVSPKDMKAARINSAEESITERGLSESATSLLDVGTVLMVARSGILKHTIPVAINDVPVAINQDIKAMHFDRRRVLPAFFVYFVEGHNDQLLLLWSKQGATVESIEHQYLADSALPLPPLPEQIAIAAFLDRETAKIDALVAEQRRLIDLLREKRQAVISHAVTKGLNPTAPRKPSGIDWLGDVPEGWEVKKVSVVCERMTYGFTNPMPTTDEGPFLLTAADIEDGGIAFSTARRTSEHAFENLLTDKSRPISGDVLITKDGTLGRVAVADGSRVCINQSVALLRLIGTEMRPQFLAKLLSGSVHQARMIYEAGGTTIKHIYISRLAQMPIPVPPIDEQGQILDWLETRLPQFDNLISEGWSALALLQERRAALISAAVTGKIDVRTTVPVAMVQPDPQDVRNAVAAAIIARLWRMPTFGRVKNQKVVYLAEAYAGVMEFRGNYTREAAGPLDRALLESLETSLERAGVIKVNQPQGKGSTVSYRFTGNADTLQAMLNEQLGPRLERFNRLLEGVADLDKRSIEAVATLFAAWNDFLIEGREPTDEDIVREVLENWHPEKSEKFKSSDLHPWLGWMRRKHVTPNGTGPKTSTGRLFP